jgi:thiaminase (transcriptional activator TenA)
MEGQKTIDSRICKNIKNCFAGYICMVANGAMADELRRHHIKYWNSLLNHKFIFEMAADSLAAEKFAFYLRQDQIFLKEFCIFLLNAKQNSIDQKLMTWFESLYCSTVDEMRMQRELIQSLGVSNNSNSAAAPATLNYVAFLRKVSASPKNLEVMISSMAPCPWSYFEIAQKLSKYNIKTEIYHKWIQFYASNESQKQVNELKNILGSRYGQADKDKRLLMEKYFGTACKHEYEFWEMAYQSHTLSASGR